MTEAVKTLADAALAQLYQDHETSSAPDSTDLDAIRDELMQLRAANHALVIGGDAWTRQANMLLLKTQGLLVALQFFKHMRALTVDHGEELRDLRDGQVMTVGYLRNTDMANEFNAAFERVRHALDGLPVVEDHVIAALRFYAERKHLLDDGDGPRWWLPGEKGSPATGTAAAVEPGESQWASAEDGSIARNAIAAMTPDCCAAVKALREVVRWREYAFSHANPHPQTSVVWANVDRALAGLPLLTAAPVAAICNVCNSAYDGSVTVGGPCKQPRCKGVVQQFT